MSAFASRTALRRSAREFLTRGQVLAIWAVVAGWLVGAAVSPRIALILLLTLVTVFYACFVGLKIWMHIAARHPRLLGTEPASELDPDLPTYTVLVPLYREANMLESLTRSLSRLRYPNDRLQVLLLLEEDDNETRAEAVAMELPPHFDIVVVPDLLPKGKPKALNVGLAAATGALCVVYDAEDRPEADQLLKAVAAFRTAPSNVACFQARLRFWNETSSWVTRFYWVEYVVHFEFFLPGFARAGLIPPLGGTSNHFRTSALRDIALPTAELPPGAEGTGAWDPWNVTEDADIAAALARAGFRVLMLDSTTREEACSQLPVADRQRRRWLKGYLQTGLVNTRDPLRNIRSLGFPRWFCFNLLMLGTPASLLLNPVLWALTITYFLTRSAAIESLFPAPIFYLGVLLILVGNLLLFFQLLAACLLREGFGSVKYMLLVPVWWLFTSYSAVRALPELLKRTSRHRWHKTEHGHDLAKEGHLALQSIDAEVPPHA
jgi:cellulose synthase/poly-beta-1,6-N-acetylglucosamine synthase-like glycosyltransferase